MTEKIKLWWKRLWCTHYWEYHILSPDRENWYECTKCGLQKDMI